MEKASMKLISSAVGGSNRPSRSLSSSTEYCAVCSSYMVFLYKMPKFEIVDGINCNGKIFLYICLPKNGDPILAYLTNDYILYFYNIKTHMLLQGSKIYIERSILHMEFSNKRDKLYFATNQIGTIYSVDINFQESSEITLPISSVCKNFAVCPFSDSHLLITTNTMDLFLYNLETEEFISYHNQIDIKSMKFSPLNNNVVLIITRRHKWKIFNVEEHSITRISQCSNKSISVGTGEWLQDSPTTIATTDLDKSVIYLWSITSGDVIKMIGLSGQKISNIISCDEKDIKFYYSNGSVANYSLVDEKEQILVNSGHTGSVFCGQFMPNDGNILATVSDDGRYCFWSIPTMKLTDSMKLKCEDFKHVYCVEFSPGGGYIVTGHDKGFISVYSNETRKLLFKEKLHNGNVLSVSWCKTQPNLIASISSDGTCIIYDIEEKQIDSPITAKDPLHKIQWSPFSTAIAIACMNGTLYIRSHGARYTLLNIGKSSLLDVQWSLTNPSILATCNENGEIAICNVENRTFKKFQAHNEACFTMAWAPSLKNILVSAGKDGMIIIWDSEKLQAISAMQAHITTIFSIAIHPDHPFLIAAMSKDTTVSLWSMEDCFKESCKTVLENKEKTLSSQIVATKGGSENIEKLVHRVLKDGLKTVFNDKDISHINDISIIMKTKANNMLKNIPLEMKTLQRAKNSRSRVIEAAELFLKLGNHKKYCELMFICGEFDKALAAAPFVSYNFWKSLMESRAMIEEKSKNSFILKILCGEFDEAINELVEMNDFDGAFLLMAAIDSHKKGPETISVFKESEVNKIPYVNDYSDITPLFDGYDIITKRVKKYKKHGKVLLAACLYLSFGDFISACWTLTFCGESLWAMEIAKKFKFEDEKFWMIHCTRLVSDGMIDEAFTLAPLRVKKQLMPMIDSSHINDSFYEKFGLQKPDFYLSQAAHDRTNMKGLNLMLGGRVQDGMNILLARIQSLLKEKVFDFIEFSNFVEILERVTETNTIVAALSFYKAIYKALWLGYIVIIPVLIQSFIECVNTDNIEFLKNRVEEVSHVSSLCSRKASTTNIRLRGARQPLSKKPVKFDGGRTVAAFSGGFPNIDANYEITSIFNTRPTESVFVLEDRATFMLKSEALKWFSVTPFSPLKTHQRYYPL